MRWPLWGSFFNRADFLLFDVVVAIVNRRKTLLAIVNTILAVVNRSRGAWTTLLAIVNRILAKRRGATKSQVTIINKRKTLLAIVTRRCGTLKSQDGVAKEKPLACQEASHWVMSVPMATSCVRVWTDVNVKADML